MADAQLSVSLSANITAFRTNMAAAASQASATGAAISTVSTNISRNIAAINNTNLNSFNRSLQAGTLSLRQFSQTVVTPTGNLSRLTAGTNTAASALQNIGRVAQDAPFGFIGIQNNLNPLLESFQRLRTETGSNAAAFKALGSSLLGPAGIGIALSVVGAAILLYQQYQQRANKETAEAEKALKNAKKSAEEYAEGLDSVSRARLVGTINAQKELVELRTLYSITQDVTISAKQRTAAVDELQKKYPEYFKNIKDEIILAGGASNAYDALSVSILATARARAAQDLLTKNASRSLENEQKLSDLQREQLKNQLALNKAKDLSATSQVSVASSTGAGTLNINAVQKVGQAQKVVENTQKRINELTFEQSEIGRKNLLLTREVTFQVKQGADLAGKVGDMGTERTKKVKTLADVLKELNIDLTQTSVLAGASFDEKNIKNIDSYQKAIDELIKLGYKPASDAVEKLIDAQSRLFQLGQNNTLQGSVNQGLLAQRNSLGQTGLNGIVVKDDGLNKFKETEKEGDKVKARLQKLVDSSNEILTRGIGSGLSGFGDSIGKALASGGNVIQAVGQGLLSGIGDILSQLGEAAIKIGVGLAAIKLGLKSLNPFVSIAAGVGLVALGAFFKARSSSIGDNVKGGSASNVTAFANGGIVSGPTLGLIGEYPGAKSDPEVVAPLSKLKDIIGKGSANNPNNSTMVMDHEIVLKGKDLALIIKRANDSRT